MCRRLIAVLLLISYCGVAQGDEKRWLKHSGYGLMFHYECFKDYDSDRYLDRGDSLWKSPSRASVLHLSGIVLNHEDLQIPGRRYFVESMSREIL